MQARKKSIVHIIETFSQPRLNIIKANLPSQIGHFIQFLFCCIEYSSIAVTITLNNPFILSLSINSNATLNANMYAVCVCTLHTYARNVSKLFPVYNSYKKAVDIFFLFLLSLSLVWILCVALHLRYTHVAAIGLTNAHSRRPHCLANRTHCRLTCT